MNDKTKKIDRNKQYVTKLDIQVSINISKIRKRLKITPLEISVYLNVNISFIKNVECYRTKYNLKHLFLLLNYFKKYDETITFNDFVNFSDQKSHNLAIEELEKTINLK